MDVERFTPTEEAILEGLATYRYLTVNQMLRVGVSKAKAHLHATIRDMQKVEVGGKRKEEEQRPRSRSRQQPPLIVEMDFGTLPTKGRLPRLYTLTPYGAVVLMEQRSDGEEIEAAKRIRMFNNDYPHRVACVDFHIALRAWAGRIGATIDFFVAYYDPMKAKSGGKLEQKTRIPLQHGVLIPDAVFSFTTTDGAQRLCSFEMYNERRTGRVEKQLNAYLVALQERAIQKTYGYGHAVRVLCVFEDRAGLRLVQERMQTRGGLGSADKFFFTKAAIDVQPAFATEWQRFNGAVVPLF